MDWVFLGFAITFFLGLCYGLFELGRSIENLRVCRIMEFDSSTARKNVSFFAVGALVSANGFIICLSVAIQELMKA